VTADNSMVKQTMHTQAQSVADDAGRKLQAKDAAVRALGITLVAISPGSAQLQMRVRADMINGAGIAHGGMITMLADSAFAFACNSYDKITLATGITVEFIMPAKLGDLLTATAREISRTGRSGIYDVVVENQHGKTVSVLRGRCKEMRDRKTV